MADAKKDLILIIEDDFEIAGMLAREARAAGFAVKAANNGTNATYLLDNTAFAACVTDLKLPGMHGLQVVNNTRATRLNAKIPIIVVSGVIDDTSAERCKELKVDRVFAKPFDAKEVMRAVRNLVDAKKEKPSPSKAQGGKSPYDVKVINAILSAIREVMESHLGTALEIQKPHLKGQDQETSAISAIISLTGNSVQGSMALVFDRPYLELLHHKMNAEFGIPVTDEGLYDLAGEMCNQVSGRVKINLAKLGLKILIGLPKVVVGKGYIVQTKTSNPALVIPFLADGKRCLAEFCFTRTLAEELPVEPEPPAVTGMIMFDE